MLVSGTSLLKQARRGQYAVGAFNINNLEILQGVVAGAVKQRAPVIIQTSQGALDYAGLEYLAILVHYAAQTERISMVLHYDHGKDLDKVLAIIDSGYYSSVMYDGSKLPFAENIKNTKRVVALAHKRGMSVEAELGAIFGREDTLNVTAREAMMTDPAQAEEFVRVTGCDSLAVSIGTAHGAYKSMALSELKPSSRAVYTGSKVKLDLKRLQTIARRVKIPLVLHGASAINHEAIKESEHECNVLGDCNRLNGAQGVPDAQIKQAIKFGISKVNIDSDLRIALLDGIRSTLIDNKTTIDPREFLGAGRNNIQKVVEQKCQLFGCAGKG